jgi:hypothetical protein
MFEVEGLRGHYLLAFGCWSFWWAFGLKVRFLACCAWASSVQKNKDWATLECSLPTMPKSVASGTPDRFNVWC